MANGFGINIAALRASRKLSDASRAQQTAFERLGSGVRINHASDDAAGLAIVAALYSNSRLYSGAIRNVNDGISALGVAESALTELGTIVSRQRELAEQATNGTYTLAQRKALHQEANALVDEFNRITNTTTFNGVQLLNEDSTLSIQVGIDGSVSSNYSTNLVQGIQHNSGTDVYNAGTSSSNGTAGGGVTLLDVNNDGKLDIITAAYNTSNLIGIQLGNGDGTFAAAITTTGGHGYNAGVTAIEGADLNEDGNIDLVMGATTDNQLLVLFGNGNGTFTAPTTFAVSGSREVKLQDVNNDGHIDMVASADFNSVQTFLGNGNGTFKAPTTVATNVYSLSLGDINNDGKVDLVSTLNDSFVYLGNGDGTYRSAGTVLGNNAYQNALADVNYDGYLDIITADYNLDTGTTASVALGNGDGTFKARTAFNTGLIGDYILQVADVDNDGYSDIVTMSFTQRQISVLHGNGDGTFRAAVTQSAGVAPSAIDMSLGDINGDGVLDIVTQGSGQATNNILLATTVHDTGAAHINLLTVADARASMTLLATTAQRISTSLGIVSAAQSRLDITTHVSGALKDSFNAAASRINDADVAMEAANLVRSQILSQAAAIVLAHANNDSRLLLDLLR